MHKRLVVALFFLLVSGLTFSQVRVLPTDFFEVNGKLKKSIRVSVTDLLAMNARNIGDVAITNHMGEPKGTAKAMKGVLVKDLLSKVEPVVENPKYLSTFYLVFTASDGYKVVYSWNEIFNSATGDNVYLVTEKEGKALSAMDERILVITPSDGKTGRRYIKGLQSISFETVK